MPVHRASIHLNAIAKQCFASHSFALAFLYAATLYFAIPLLYLAQRYFASPPLRIAQPNLAVAFPGASRRLISIPSHRASLLLNTSPSLSETCLSHSAAVPCHTLLFLCCSSGSKTELSLPYAVLDCAALHLSAAMPSPTPPGVASLRLSFAVLSFAE